MDFDVYYNVDEITINEEYNKLKKNNEVLQDHIKRLENDITKLCNEVSKMKSTQDNLSINISELYKTAKMELERKDKYIANLRRQLDDLLFKRNNKNTVLPQPVTSITLEEGELEEHSDSKSISTREMDSDENKETKDRCDRPSIKYYKNRNDYGRERHCKSNDRRRYNSPVEKSRYRDTRRDIRNTMSKNKRWRSPSPERHRRYSPKRHRKDSKSPPRKESDFRDIQKHTLSDSSKDPSFRSKCKKIVNIEEGQNSNYNKNDGGKQNLTGNTEINLERTNSNSELEILDKPLEKVDILECKIKQKMSLNDYRNKFQNVNNTAKRNNSDVISIDEDAVATENQQTIGKPNEQESEGLNDVCKDIVTESKRELLENNENFDAEKKVVEQKPVDNSRDFEATKTVQILGQNAVDNSKDSQAIIDIKTEQSVLSELQDSTSSTSSSILNEFATSQNKVDVVKVPKKKKRWTMLV